LEVSERPRTDTRGEPTPGERLLYALGQLYRQYRVRATLTPPCEVDVEAVARMLAIWSDVEFIQQGEDEGEEYLHLPAEVLLIDRRQAFPWQLMDPFEWARELELKDFWRYWH
jgi:hypothetical protein